MCNTLSAPATSFAINVLWKYVIVNIAYIEILNKIINNKKIKRGDGFYFKNGILYCHHRIILKWNKNLSDSKTWYSSVFKNSKN